MKIRTTVTLWAWIISVTVHVTAFALFAALRTPQPDEAQASSLTPQITIQQHRQFEMSPTVPKPNVNIHTVDTAASTDTKNVFLSSDNLDMQIDSQQLDFNTSDIQYADIPAMNTQSDNIFSLGQIEFQNPQSKYRKVFFVVDCSGSMTGMLKWVKAQLADTISKLQQDQYFGLVFFGQGSTFEFAQGSMVRASAKNKRLADEFMQTIASSGDADALSALKKAINATDAKGNNPSVIFLLTDGFELVNNSRQISNIINKNVRINTIGFWPQDDDKDVLKKIADDTNGQFVFINDQFFTEHN